ncbi:hypothetical protein IMSHALPRED_005987 [Imshaugia aleurites]|uniref:L-ornithine N(5)-monooxygenase n=1 Tax=Imshaugia aleurites TaxID=172621 RepID=A0A8H3IQI2_9LECA|nr:hypothetical protein IMSHALPRED_005987 [Imshaugia aleurites]
MALRPIPEHVDTVIVGNGPSALILSFILHGNIPYYSHSRPHPDPILHKKLSESSCLLDVDVQDLTAHFAASRLSYSTQALPINVLLDTLLRPLADTDPEEYDTCLEWRLEPGRKVSHVVLGNTAQVGGQWADNPVSASWDIGALSYAEMLSLPGYTFEEHYKNTRGGTLPKFHRPTRREVAEYLARYPEEVGIQESVYTNLKVGDVRRVDAGFYVESHNIICRHLVLASGIFSSLIPPRPSLRPLSALPRSNASSDAPLLVVGSGFTAADVIISTPAHRKIIHIFKWDPESRPSPLRACHLRAYPEYARVYRRMKLAAKQSLGPRGVSSPLTRRKSDQFFEDVAGRDRDHFYEGLPNTYIKEVAVSGDTAHLSLETGDGTMLQREISSMEYVIGRRGSLAYLNNSLAEAILGTPDETKDHPPAISGRTLRSRSESNLELAPDIFVTGSLTGDSLIRFAYGSCVFAAREIIRRTKAAAVTFGGTVHTETASIPTDPLGDPPESGHHDFISTNGHSDLHVDRAMRSLSMDREISTCEPWRESGWWAGGCILS